MDNKGENKAGKLNWKKILTSLAFVFDRSPIEHNFRIIFHPKTTFVPISLYRGPRNGLGRDRLHLPGQRGHQHLPQ